MSINPYAAYSNPYASAYGGASSYGSYNPYGSSYGQTSSYNPYGSSYGSGYGSYGYGNSYDPYAAYRQPGYDAYGQQSQQAPTPTPAPEPTPAAAPTNLQDLFGPGGLPPELSAPPAAPPAPKGGLMSKLFGWGIPAAIGAVAGYFGSKLGGGNSGEAEKAGPTARYTDPNNNGAPAYKVTVGGKEVALFLDGEDLKESKTAPDKLAENVSEANSADLPAGDEAAATPPADAAPTAPPATDGKTDGK